MSVFFMDFDMAPSVIWARDLYDQMQIRSDFRKWFPRMCQYGFVEGRDYEFVPRVRPQDEGGRTVQRYVKDYRITLEMAKQLYKLHHFHKNDCFHSCEGQHCMGTDHWMQAVIELLHQHKCKSHAPPKRFYEWHIVENAHEAIILKSDFEKVQARREQNKEKRERAMARSKATREKCYNHLSGMVYCGCCRRNMTFERRVHGTVKETHYGVFICKRKKNTTPCAYHAVPEKMLMMVAMDQIHHLVSTMCEEEKLVKDMMRGSNLDSARSIKMKENSILFRIQEAEERRLRLYEDYKAEILDEDEYSQLKEHYIAEKQRLEHELQKQRQRALELEKRIKICDAQMERMRGILNQNEFDEELVHELIKRIYVGMDNSVEVEFKCSDPYQEVLAIMSEVQNE